MNKASEYLKNAEACRQLATSMEGEQRTALLEMASTWERLAADRVDHLRRHPELVGREEDEHD